jgi:AraC-like DNA-binding protein
MTAPAIGATQNFSEYAPPRELAHFVAALWVQSVPAGDGPYPQRGLPHGGVDLVVVSGGDPQVVGPHSRARVTTVKPGATVIGMRLRPGAAASLLRTPVSELVDVVAPAADLLGTGMRRAAERIGAETSLAGALQQLQRYASEQVVATSSHDPAVLAAVRLMQRGRFTQVSDLPDQLGISARQLRRRFRHEVGVSPKTLHRILRFQTFLALAQRNVASGLHPSGPGVAALAEEVGYSDQAHLTRECARLTGLTPGTLFAEMAGRCAGHSHAASFQPLVAMKRAGGEAPPRTRASAARAGNRGAA